MHISELHISGFRCFGPDHPLTLPLKPHLNILIGPNDSGKTAVIDAFRHVLWTRGDDFIRLDPTDFHCAAGKERVTELLVRCTFDALTPDEEARFLEWCSNESGVLRLHVCLRASLKRMPGGGFSVIPVYRTGKDGDGLPLEGELREFLKTTYLKPLRDAERELSPGRRSRLSRILGALPSMATQSGTAGVGEDPTLSDLLKQANQNVENNKAVKKVQKAVNDKYLGELSFSGDPLQATLGMGAKGSFDQLLERLELFLNSPSGQTQRSTRGLGYNNILFMAAELLLLQSHSDQVACLLVEEPEAHLHPQHQTLFMKVLQNRLTAKEAEGAQPVQVLLTTHSPQLAASAELDSMIIMVGHQAYPLSESHTKLKADDYEFLRRFLDATKANLFFARGVVLVEGTTEAILLPALARKMGRDFAKHGVSVVNVGHRGLFRYSRIFQRTDGSGVPLPVALIPDRDLPPSAAKDLVTPRLVESEIDAEKLKEHISSLTEHDGAHVKTFPSEQWTLEFDLARKPEFVGLIHEAIRVAKGSAKKTKKEIAENAASELSAWLHSMSADEIAVKVFTPLYKEHVGKPAVAEELARIVEQLDDDADSFKLRLPAYLVNAIEYVTTPTMNEAAEKSPTTASAAA